MEIIFFSSKQDLDAFNHYLNKNNSIYKDNEITYLRIMEEEREEICFFLAKWLHHIHVHTAVRDGLRTHFDFLSYDEIYGVKNFANQHLEQEEAKYISCIQNNLLLFTEISSTINLDGFWNFATQDYENKIVDVLEKSLDEYWAEQEYYEFIHMLHCFIQLEKTHISQLTIITASNGNYQLYDENYNDITRKCKEILQNEFADIKKEDIEQENDFLISILIILLPQKINFYGTKYIKNKNFLYTLQTVFANRIILEEENPCLDL